MNYLQKKKLAFMSIVNSVKGFVRTVSGVPPLTLPDCVDEESIIDYSITGNGVGDYDEETGKYKIPVVCSGKNLFNISKATNGTILSNTGAGALPSNRVRTNFIYLKAGVYCASTVGTTKDIMFGACHTYSSPSEDTWLGTVPTVYTSTGTRNSKVFTLTQDCYVRLPLLPTTTSSIKNLSISNLSNYKPQIEIGDVPTDYESFVEPITTNIIIDEPLTEGETLKNPVKLPTIKGTTILSVDTEVQPSNMKVTYYSTSKE